MKNPSIVLYGAKNAKLEQRPVPELSDPNNVIVRIAYVGVCGSDVSTSTALSTPYLLIKRYQSNHYFRSTNTN